MRRYMIVAYDVTDLNDIETDALSGEAQAMAERSEDHPSVGVVAGLIDADETSDAAGFVGVFVDSKIEIGAFARTTTIPILDLSGGS